MEQLEEIIETMNRYSLTQLRRYLQENPEEYNEEKHGEFFSKEEKRNLLNRKRGNND